MRQAIVVKYFGPTDFKDAHLRARADAGSISVPWDHGADRDENYERAARLLMNKLEWKGRPVAGAMPDGRVAFVILDDPAAPPKCKIQWVDPSTGNPTPDENDAVGYAVFRSKGKHPSGADATAEKRFPICAHHLARMPHGNVGDTASGGNYVAEWTFEPLEV